MNVPTKIFVAVCLACFIGQVKATSPTFCKSDEQVVFSCLVGRKTASVCLSPSYKLQFRFGKFDGGPEFVYPLIPDGTNSGFRFLVEGRSAKGSVTNLQFTHARTTYTIFRFTHSFEGNYAGIAVAKPGSPLIRLTCTESTVQESFFGSLGETVGSF